MPFGAEGERRGHAAPVADAAGRDQHARPMRSPTTHADDQADRRCGDGHGNGVDRPAGLRERSELGQDLAGLLAREREAEQIADLAGEDDDRDAGGKSHRHRIGNELDVGAEPQETRCHQQKAGDRRRQHQAVDPMAVDRRSDQDDERAGRPADLEAAAAQRRDQEAADDRGVEAALRRGAGGDRDRHRQGQRHDRDGEAGHDVGPQRPEAVTLAQDRDQFRREERAEAGRSAAALKEVSMVILTETLCII